MLIISLLLLAVLSDDVFFVFNARITLSAVSEIPISHHNLWNFIQVYCSCVFCKHYGVVCLRLILSLHIGFGMLCAITAKVMFAVIFGFSSSYCEPVVFISP